MKENCGPGSFLREAMILKSLKHPGIPVIYDLEEDQYYFYLIEEYLEGESLFALIKRQGNLSKVKVLSYGIELCQIMNYLHSLKPNPILYLDLQPKNLLICDGILKLIDFDQAVSAAFAGCLKKRYGTVGCAAPEQFTDEPLDQRTDIYAIGALLHYMGTGTFWNREGYGFEGNRKDGLDAVIRRCLCPIKEERYSDVASLLEELQKLRSGVFKEKQMSLLKIAVVCSNHGMGATHVSLGLSSYLSRKGTPNLYVEKNQSGMALDLMSYFGRSPDKEGICRVKNWNLRPCYGQCVKLDEPDFFTWIEDYGADTEAACKEEHTLTLLVCGGKWWELKASVKAIRGLLRKGELKVLFNHLPAGWKLALPEDILTSHCFRLPFFPDPEDSSIDGFYETLLAESKALQILDSGQAGSKAGKKRKNGWKKRKGLIWKNANGI